MLLGATREITVSHRKIAKAAFSSLFEPQKNAVWEIGMKEDLEDKGKDSPGMHDASGTGADRVTDIHVQDAEAALEKFKQCPSDEILWKTVMAFAGTESKTMKGLDFTYSLKMGRNGTYTDEIFVDRKEKSKSITKSSILLAYHRALELEGDVKGPKKLGQIFGISYIYSILMRFGVIKPVRECQHAGSSM